MFGLSGWKTKVGGVSAIVGGLALCLNEAVSFLNGHGLNIENLTTGWAGIAGGFVALGIGHKLDKAAVK